MARSSDPDSANSQFFITFNDYPSLDNEYKVFGQVISGMQFIDSLARGEPPADAESISSMDMSKFKQLGTLNFSNHDDVLVTN